MAALISAALPRSVMVLPTMVPLVLLAPPTASVPCVVVKVVVRKVLAVAGVTPERRVTGALISCVSSTDNMSSTVTIAELATVLPVVSFMAYQARKPAASGSTGVFIAVLICNSLRAVSQMRTSHI